MISTKVPEWATPFVIGRATLCYDGKEYEYLIISSAAQKIGTPALFAMYISGAMGVSDTYPEKYRELGLIHEIMEMGYESPIPETACVESLKKELQLAESQGIDMLEYVAFRTRFFSGLIEYYEKMPLYSSVAELLVRLRHSLKHLKQYRP
jgi:hypothetical protein